MYDGTTGVGVRRWGGGEVGIALFRIIKGASEAVHMLRSYAGTNMKKKYKQFESITSSFLKSVKNNSSWFIQMRSGIICRIFRYSNIQILQLRNYLANIIRISKYPNTIRIFKYSNTLVFFGVNFFLNLVSIEMYRKGTDNFDTGPNDCLKRIPSYD